MEGGGNDAFLFSVGLPPLCYRGALSGGCCQHSLNSSTSCSACFEYILLCVCVCILFSVGILNSFFFFFFLFSSFFLLFNFMFSHI